MATSRYDTAATTAANAAGNSTRTGTESQSSTQTSNTNQTSNSTNMDPTSLAALQQLIAQLATGGTADMRATNAARNNQIETVGRNQLAYSKEAAFADAQGLIAQTMRQALEKMLPGINSASLGAGASQSSMRALLTQKAAENAAEMASAQGINAAGQYGQVFTGLSGVLQQLTSQQDPATQALLNALAVAKGAVTSTNTNTTGTTTGNTTNNSTINTNTGVTPRSPGLQAPAYGSTGFYGPTETEKPSGIGGTMDTLSQLWGSNQFVDNYTF